MGLGHTRGMVKKAGNGADFTGIYRKSDHSNCQVYSNHQPERRSEWQLEHDRWRSNWRSNPIKVVLLYCRYWLIDIGKGGPQRIFSTFL